MGHGLLCKTEKYTIIFIVFMCIFIMNKKIKYGGIHSMAKKMSIKEKRAQEEAQRKARFQEQNRQREAEIEKEKSEKNK